MRRIAFGVAVLSAAATLAACKGDAKTTSFVFSPDAGAVPGYLGGTPVTLTDGTPVTLKNGSPVTTPVLKDKNGNPITTVKGNAAGSSTTVAGGGGGGGPSTTSFVQPTGTTVVSSKPNEYTLVFPKQGVYGFHEHVASDDGANPKDSDVFYNLTSPDQHVQIKWQKWTADNTAAEAEYYTESHDSDGLWLVESALVGGGKCGWSPKSAELPKSIVDKIGTKASTDSACTATLNGKDTSFNVHTDVQSIDIEQLLIGGKAYDCIKIERNRVLTSGSTKFTTTAHDWYAFDLGMRVKVSDHTTIETPQGTSAAVRDLTLTKLA